MSTTGTRRHVRLLAAPLALGAAAVLLAGCGSGGSSGPSASTLLEQARATLDHTQGLHFTLAATGLPSSGTTVSSGEGDVVRPAAFKGSFKVSENGLQATVQVVSVNGTFYAQLPFTTGFTKLDPSSVGVPDPAKLLDPTTGLGTLLTSLQKPTGDGQHRIGGEVVDEVTGRLPGDAIAKLLPYADASKPAGAFFGIDPKTKQLRTARLVGPFFDKSTTSTVTLTLTKYGEKVTISAPSG
jgi:lipoprotein LprG